MIPEPDARLGEILEVLLAIARQDFEARAPVSGSGDVLDAIAVGLNMLAEELKHEVASRTDLEQAHAELKAAEARLIHAGKLAVLGQLASGVAHEINNPAMSLEAALAIVKRLFDEIGQNPDDRASRAQPVARAALDDAFEAISRIRRVSRDLRTFARTDDDVYRQVRLHEVASASCRLALPTLRAHVELGLHLNPVPPVLGNRGRLGQVVTNLLVNAAQALRDDSGAPHHVDVTTDCNGEDVTLTVDDNGRGVDPALREKIFEPFFTTKPEGVGTGLGLSLVAEIVRAHGGSIRVGSSPRGGARFELRFPLAREASPPRRSTPPTLPGPDRRMRLLLIDDEPTILRLFSTLLAERFDVTTCGEGAAAIKLLERDRAFDVILCDLQMPRTDGIHVHEAVQRLEPALLGRFVFTTGGAVTQRGRDFLDHQAPRLLPKPFSINDLYAAIAEMSGDGTE